MLGPGRYLLGIAELLALVGCAGLGACSLRRRFLPRLEGTPAALATVVLALAPLIWWAELLGSFGSWTPLPYLAAVAATALALWWAMPAGGLGSGEGGDDDSTAGASSGGCRGGRGARTRPPTALLHPRQDPPAGAPSISPTTLASLAIAALALVHFAAAARPHLSTGMTGFDSTWYHGPFAAGFLQSGDTWRLHFIAPQFLAWFYPANGEILPAAGMLAFGRDLLSPLLNIGWFAGCLLCCWCLGRPFRVAPWSLGLGALALSVPALADQAGEARNDLAGIFFLLAALALALNAAARRGRGGGAGAGSARPAGEVAPAAALSPAELATAGLAAGLAAGTKLNFLLPAAVLVLGLAAVAPRGARGRALLAAGVAALAGGGYWYLRNFAHAGNPLPWVHHLGPLTLPAPEQALGGREAHSVLAYRGDGGVWSDWFLPGLHHGLTVLWPLLLLAALAGLALALPPLACRSLRPRGGAKERRGGGGVASAAGLRRRAGLRHGAAPDAVLALAGLVGLAAALAWLLAPTSASGPAGLPRGFESGLRYLAPALVLGLALLPAAPPLRSRLAAAGPSLRVRSPFGLIWGPNGDRTPGRRCARRTALALAALAVLLVAAVGYPVQRHYLQNRYANPTFSAPGLDAAFAWARDVSGARIATTSTRQYPLFGTDLSNRVQFLGEESAHGGFESSTSCPQWRRLLDAGHYDYVVTSRDRIEKGKAPYPATTRWTEGPAVREMLRKPPTVVFELTGRLDPAACP